MSSKVNIKKRLMLEALEKTLGVVTTACKEVGFDRTLHYRWLKNDPDYKEAVESIEDIALDFAESNLFKLIKGGDTPSTIFYLKTKGKKRGYVERTEHTGKDGEKLMPTIVVSSEETKSTLEKIISENNKSV